MPSTDPQADADRTAAELRDLIREAHGAVKDLRGAIREANLLGGQIADAVAVAAHEAAVEEMRRGAAHLQREMNRNASRLNTAVEAAQHHIAKGLSQAWLEAEPDPDGRFRVVFDWRPFDDQIPADEPEPAEPTP